MFEVRETAQWVAERSTQVQIDREALLRFSRELVGEGVEIPPWESTYHYSGKDEEMVAYFLVLDSINFCFWPWAGKRRWEIHYGSGRLSGYYALAASLKRAVESGVPLTQAAFLAEVDENKLRRILGGEGELKLMAERAQILREVGETLLQDYDGKAIHLVESAGQSATGLTRLAAGKLQSFRDMARYQDRLVFFYKRAQILAADLHGAFNGKGWGRFSDMDQLTAFADYKLPQVLRHLGVLCYEAELGDRVDRMDHVEAGSPEAVEIRANTLWAVELIRQELAGMGKNLRAYEIDWILWSLGQRDEFRAKPYHRTVTIFY
jgi:hypothetical protein